MKFVSLTKSIAVPHQIHTYTELRQQIHDDLRIQHPEWIESNGEAPMCDFYEARLMDLLHFEREGAKLKREQNTKLKIARVLVRFDHVARSHRKRESQRDVIDCETLQSRLHF